MFITHKQIATAAQQLHKLVTVPGIAHGTFGLHIKGKVELHIVADVGSKYSFYSTGAANNCDSTLIDSLFIYTLYKISAAQFLFFKRFNRLSADVPMRSDEPFGCLHMEWLSFLGRHAALPKSIPINTTLQVTKENEGLNLSVTPFQNSYYKDANTR